MFKFYIPSLFSLYVYRQIVRLVINRACHIRVERINGICRLIVKLKPFFHRKRKIAVDKFKIVFVNSEFYTCFIVFIGYINQYRNLIRRTCRIRENFPLPTGNVRSRIDFGNRFPVDKHQFVHFKTGKVVNYFISDICRSQLVVICKNISVIITVSVYITAVKTVLYR